MNMRMAPLFLGLLAMAFGASAETKPILLHVDVTDASRKILHARMNVPAKPGKLTLLYPEWLPGHHGPVGPIADLAGLKIKAGEKDITWQRDPENMYAFHLEVPRGVEGIDVSLDFLLSANSSVSSKLLVLSWNVAVLYPKGVNASELQYAPTLRLPDNWKFGTALSVASQSAGEIKFAPVSLETLVDSPVIAGAHFRSIDLTPGTKPPHWLHVVADSESALEIKAEDTKHFSRLPAEAGALFGAWHYDDYHFLLTLSDHVAHFGLEHHESSDNRRKENFLTDESERKRSATLLPHELVHAWNGKYRRPAGLATGDYDRPMHGDLLWVYEGLTDYLGSVLATRSGLWTNEDFRASVALTAARLDHTTGRTWRPLSDTTAAAQLLYGARAEGAAWRRGTDFYAEGGLIWLEVDVLIRRKTEGRKSLNDFCQRFYGGKNSPPGVVPYVYNDVVAALNEVAPHDWNQFFQQRIYTAVPRAPIGGIENGGWRLTYTNKPPELLKISENARKYTEVIYSIGVRLKEDGSVMDIIPGSPADKAGIGVTMKLVAVNGRRWTPAILRKAIDSTSTGTPLELLVEHHDFYKTCKLDYESGDKYPQLERDPSKPDLLSDITKPLVP